jgi:hypothetical protein
MDHFVQLGIGPPQHWAVCLCVPLFFGIDQLEAGFPGNILAVPIADNHLTPRRRLSIT